MTDIVRPIQLSDHIIKSADDVHTFKMECANLKSKSEKVAALLRQAARESTDIYERPTHRIINDTDQVLERALAIVTKCSRKRIISRLFPRVHINIFRNLSAQLENSIGDVSWLLRVSAANGDNEHLGLPPIASSEPILFLIWEKIANLYTGSLDVKSDAASTLVSLARQCERYGKLIIEEHGVDPLLKLVKDGQLEGQENAARAIGLLGRDPESVEHMIQAGVCSVFAQVLKEGVMKVQAVVAWAISELAANHPGCQDLFAENNIIRLLVGHLAFETVEEHSKYAITSNKNLSIHSVVMASSSNQQRQNPDANSSRESEDADTKAMMKAMSARALWHLASGNYGICKSITESRALLCFAILLEKGSGEAQHNSAMALMEITAVAEKHDDLRRSAFKPSSHACKVVVDKLLNIIEKADPALLIPCIKSVGHLARTFKATETRIIGPLVRLLEGREAEVSREAASALAKFASTENYLHLDHSKAIINAGGVEHLTSLVCFGEIIVRIPSLVLLSYLALHFPDDDAIAHAQVLAVLDSASKEAHMVQDPSLETLLPEAKSRLELHRSRVSRDFH